MILAFFRHEILTTARQLGVDLTSASIIDPVTYADIEPYQQHLYEKRKHKGLTYDLARDALNDVNMFGTVTYRPIAAACRLNHYCLC